MNSLPTADPSMHEHYVLGTRPYEGAESDQNPAAVFQQPFGTLSGALLALLDSSLALLCPGLATSKNAPALIGSNQILCIPSGYKVSLGLSDDIWMLDGQRCFKVGIISNMPKRLFQQWTGLGDPVFAGRRWPVFIPLLTINENNQRQAHHTRIANIKAQLSSREARQAKNPHRLLPPSHHQGIKP
ncbi:hypothetical protein HB364_13830 [Pseudoflavitalea sp. X16]|uniref:hypothetical protein n=1 Tax=Paraflavitalea devenefica TaxID=2716334 RepID=UPI00141EBC0D|nr:hypothetical protein [Paraflavitalea devenefica]NII26168.1 hypothetical protein [Paraflavitalea devenefica]